MLEVPEVSNVEYETKLREIDLTSLWNSLVDEDSMGKVYRANYKGYS